LLQIFSYGVMVALLILVQTIVVRVHVGEQKRPDDLIIRPFYLLNAFIYLTDVTLKFSNFTSKDCLPGAAATNPIFAFCFAGK
jgi:hypothetical protein